MLRRLALQTIGLGIGFVVLASLVILVAGSAEGTGEALRDMAIGFPVMALVAALVTGLLSRAGDRTRPPG